MQRRPLNEIPLRKITSSPLATATTTSSTSARRSIHLLDRTPKHHSEGAPLSPRSPHPGASESWTIFEDTNSDNEVAIDSHSHSSTPTTPGSIVDEEGLLVVDENENPPPSLTALANIKSPVRRPPLMPFRYSSTPSLVSSQPVAENSGDDIDEQDDGETPKYKTHQPSHLTPRKTPQSASKAHGKRMLECEDEFDSPMSSILSSATKRRRLME
ncbi:hypothetical protein E3P99_01692 [Wallemia hederae]|uniref:Uncharacterized protein n=1 Tax=Wallemia hederae TaxID=1540922 RepID=A0A4T0FP04_9BASI|nr:hypothetical protein E3P99_01692 [Wallemia hederae]